MNREVYRQERVYSVLDINQEIRNLLRSNFSTSFWVWGEVQDLKIASSRRHIYFSLVQKHPQADEIVARIRAIIFENVKEKINARLKLEDRGKESPGSLETFLQEGREIKVLCRLNVYPRQGNYYLEIYALDVAYTLGKIAQRRQEILEQLRREGVLDKNKTVFLPLVPLNIGLITAYYSAAFSDFIAELRSFRFSFKIFIYDAHMQGNLTEKDVVSGIRLFNRDFSSLDVIVITRGGGSLADLSWFDSQKIAKAIAASKLPVISALGHQINLTITDVASWSYFKTPTKAAQFLGKKVEDFLQDIEQKKKEIIERSREICQRENMLLEVKFSRIASLAERYLSEAKNYLAVTENSLKAASYNILNILRKDLHHICNDISTAVMAILEKERLRVDGLERRINLLKPREILRRGFSITLIKNKPLRDAGRLKKGEMIETVLFKGKLNSVIAEIKKEKE